MYFYPWSSSSFPISSETGRGLTSIFFAWVDNCNPPNKLWLLLAFFLLKILCFTLYKDRSEIPSNFKSYMHHDTDSSVYQVQTLFRQPLDQSGKKGKTFALFAHSSNPKIPSSSQQKNQILQPSVLTARKANAIPLQMVHKTKT